MQNKQIVAGNWKMNGLTSDVENFTSAFLDKVEPGRAEVIICPPFTLTEAFAEVAGTTFAVGGQDCHPEESGAFTGNISAPMLKDLGCKYVIVGHSERRAKHFETNFLVNHKAVAAQKAGLIPILCIGETLKEREDNKTQEVLSKQVKYSIPSSATEENLIIAYEPVWSIGTGLVPTDEQIVETIAQIREAIKIAFSEELSTKIKILYGGSVNAKNAKQIMSLQGVDGVLVGGASLSPEGFAEIVAGAKPIN